MKRLVEGDSTETKAGLKMAHLYFGLLSMTGVLLWGCANIVSPSGGPRDIKPPEVLEMIPPDLSTSFKDRTIAVTFNEFIEVKDIGSELFVSPPMPAQPELRIRGKRLIITLPDSLLKETTYTMSFGKAIRDITEGNILEDFTYSFSTGPIRDSLIMRGKIVDAFSGEPLPGLIACLYADLSDTAFISDPPMYIARSNAQGEFTLRNLADKPYRLYGLKDMNSNYYYDQPNELIAFIQDTLFPDKPPIAIDTTVDPDTLAPIQEMTEQAYHALRMFTDRDSAQAMLRAFVMKRQHIQVAFRNPVDIVSIQAWEMPDDPPWYTLTWNPGRDTLSCWLLQNLTDSLTLVIADVGKTMDTVALNLRPRPESRGPRRDASDMTTFTLSTNSQLMADPHLPVELIAPYPLSEIKPGHVRWIHEEDTTSAAYAIKSGDPFRVIISSKPIPGEKYTLIVSDSAYTDIRGFTNEAATFSYQMRTLDDYGQFKLNVTGIPEKPWFIDLLSKEKRFLQRLPISSSREIENNRMLPGTYLLRLVYDENGNNRWDPGFFKAGLQPEEVHYFPSEIEIRAKWERQETWDLSPGKH